VHVCAQWREREKERQPATHIATLISFFFVDVRSFTEIHLLPFSERRKKEGIPVSLVLICLLLFGKCV